MSSSVLDPAAASDTKGDCDPLFDVDSGCDSDKDSAATSAAETRIDHNYGPATNLDSKPD